MNKGIGVWIRELRAPFLALPVLYVSLSILAAVRNGYFDALLAVLSVLGATLLHMGANVLNDYFDYRSGIDIFTTPTPFSGGSGILPKGLLTPRGVLIYGSSFLVLGSLVGLYIISALSFPIVLVAIAVVAVASVLLYSRVLSAVGAGEVSAFLNFGPLMLLGGYYVQTGSVSLEPLLVGVVTGLMTAGVLYINEFPDTGADAKHGRLHLVARLGKRRAVNGFKLIMGLAYLVLITSAVLRITPLPSLIALLSLPRALRAVRILNVQYEKVHELIPAMGETVMATLQTALLLALGYSVSIVLNFVGLPL